MQSCPLLHNLIVQTAGIQVGIYSVVTGAAIVEEANRPPKESTDYVD